MAVNSKLNKLHGWLFVDKPLGVSSFFVVHKIKKLLGLPKSHKIGHGGTLDTLAEGVLPIAIGEATKTISYVMNSKKTYEFTIQFGFKTSTQDKEGEIIASTTNIPSAEELLRACNHFRGEILQEPSKFSAIKINGRRAYDLARSGVNFSIKKRLVNIYELHLKNFDTKTSQATFISTVSKGTYIRALAEDIASKVDSLGYVIYLRRTRIHTCKEKLLISLNTLYTVDNVVDSLITIEDMLDDILAYSVTTGQAKEVLNGNLSSLLDCSEVIFKVVCNTKILALVDNTAGNLKILRVFNHYKDNIRKGEKIDVT